MLPILIALQFLTRIPIRFRKNPNHDDLAKSLIFFPLVGAMIGSIVALVWKTCFYLGFSHSISSASSIVAGLLLTGALHEDGMADTIDGFGGGKDRKDILRIMRNSHLGSFASLGMVGVFVLRMSSLESIDPSRIGASLILAHTLSRWAAVQLIVVSPPVQRKQTSLAMILCRGSSWLHLILSGITAISISYWASSHFVWPLLVSVIVTVAVLQRWYRQKIGGITGDCIGFCIILIELLMLAFCSLVYSGLDD